MDKKEMDPTLAPALYIGIGRVGYEFAFVKRTRTCRYCNNSIPKDEYCLEEKIPGSPYAITNNFCMNCAKGTLLDLKKESLDTITRIDRFQEFVEYYNKEHPEIHGRHILNQIKKGEEVDI